MSNQELVSIIVPIYNVEKYLKQCIDSIINQTYKNLEIILVDDGSKDKTLSIAEKYALNDERIKVFSVENSGVSNARNFGIKQSSGDYIMFVDSDDWLDSETCEVAIKTLSENKSDVVIWSYISEHEQNSVKKDIFNSDFIVFDRKNNYFDLQRIIVGYLGNELKHPETKDSLSPVWGKLYKKSIIKSSGAYFEDLKNIGTYEDGLFNILYFGNVNSAVYINKHFYHYRRTNGSSITSKYKKNLFEQWNNLYDILENYIKKNNFPEIYFDALNSKIALNILGLGLNESNCEQSVFALRKKLKFIFFDKRYKKALASLDCKYMPFHWKVFYGAAKNRFIWLYIFLLSVIKKLIY